VLFEFRWGTDLLARRPDFQKFARDLAAQISIVRPDQLAAQAHLSALADIEALLGGTSARLGESGCVTRLVGLILN
jgi:hypothetical protein